jgi:phosphopantothenoylcysteine synthetase/decarboxylase
MTKKTFSTLSRNQVITDLWETPEWQPGHIALAEKAKLLVVAPATANFLAKFANGIADDAISTYALSHSGEVVIAPAMNPKMWNNPAVQSNVEVLKRRNIQFIGPATGKVACGADGTGRMDNVPNILNFIFHFSL